MNQNVIREHSAVVFFFSSRRRHTRYWRDWSSDVCSSDLKGKVVVVTGGANGIGRALCLRFAKEGARLVGCADVDEDNGFKVLKELEEGRGAFFCCDVSKESQVKFMVDTVTSAVGRIDIFCSN